jgi:hypothetical protein
MIVRQWHGWTSKDNAGAYEELFRSRGPNIRRVDGRVGAYLLRRETDNEVEFIVQHLFESMDALRTVYGEDYELGRLIPGAEKLLSRYDEKCTHYQVADAPR